MILKIFVLTAAAIIATTTAANAACDDGCQNACAGYAAFETAHQMLHIENISHAEASELINKSSPKVRAYAARAFDHCVAMGANLPIHHYCHAPDDFEMHPYKCKEHRPFTTR
jgi:hypothetical protein